MKENTENSSFDSLFVKKRNVGFKIFVFVFVFLLLAALSVYSYLSISAVRVKMIEAHTNAVSAESNDPAMIDLLKDKAWVESQLKMASADSIGIAIDLKEKVIQLELKGLVVMKSKIRDYSSSGFFKKMNANLYFTMFGTPLTITRIESSIAKNRFKVVQAPKDTIAAQAAVDAEIKNDSLKKEDIFWTVKLDRDIELNIQGIDSLADAKSKYKFGQGFEFKRDLANILKGWHQIIKFKRPDYTPEILISIPENEAKSILMALPRKAWVTIRI